MADTRYLTQVVEPYVRRVLSERYSIEFASRQLPLISGGRHEFDAVSLDERTVAAIKTASGKTTGGKRPSGKIQDAVAEIYFLTLVPAERRMLVLTTPSFFDLIRRYLHGRLAQGIELHLVELPAPMQAAVDQVKQVASAEVSPVLSRHKPGPSTQPG